MSALVDILNWVNLGLFTLVALVALVQWRRGRGRGALWAALTFGALALVVDVGRALPDDPTTDLERAVSRTLVAVLVLFPYLLYRFTTAFQTPARRVERFVGLMTAVLVVWTVVLPEFPEPGEPRPAWFLAYLVAFLVHWSVLAVIVAFRLWLAGRGQPSVARRRMRLLAGAAAAITAALFLAAVGSPEDGSELDVAVTVLVGGSAAAFLLGLAPPWVVRMFWRRPEQQRLQAAIADIMGATSQDEVTRRVLEPMARIVGARAVAVRDRSGEVIGAFGDTEELAAAIARGDESPPPNGDVVNLELPEGSLLVWRSPYAPYFGDEELSLLRTLGVLTGLALDRSRLFAQERDARLALERADEVKTHFVALAAHELRTPVATIDGIVQTLHLRGDRLTEDRRELLERTLRQQSGHMRLLVDQLLDLSRLEADAVRLDPQPFAVRRCVEGVVQAAAGERAEEVRVDVEDGLEAVADSTAFERIVANLVVNALRYGAPPVIVSAERRDRHFRLAVEDRGPGVPPELVPNLFERFTRGRTSRERTVGTGLGLAIARSYAAAHGGDLRYEDAKPSGARFRLVLPVEPPGDGNGRS